MALKPVGSAFGMNAEQVVVGMTADPTSSSRRMFFAEAIGLLSVSVVAVELEQDRRACDRSAFPAHAACALAASQWPFDYLRSWSKTPASFHRFMPRFFIDLHDGANFEKDSVGFDVPDVGAVRSRVLGVVARYARDLSADEDRQDLFVIVRDDAGRIVLRAHLSLDLEMLEQA